MCTTLPVILLRTAPVPAGGAPVQQPRSPVTVAPDADNPISPFVRHILQDRRGDLWMGANGDGVLRYEGGRLERFSVDQGLASDAPQRIYQNRDGRLWCGGHMGLYRLEGNAFVSVTEAGPWQ
jgi:ligand-binding sensor domain-containing protein